MQFIAIFIATFTAICVFNLLINKMKLMPTINKEICKTKSFKYFSLNLLFNYVFT